MGVRWNFTGWKRYGLLWLWGLRTYPTTKHRTYGSSGRKTQVKIKGLQANTWTFSSSSEYIWFIDSGCLLHLWRLSCPWTNSLPVSRSPAAHKIVSAQPLAGSHLVQPTWWHERHFTALSHLLWFLHHFVLLEFIIPFPPHQHKPSLWIPWLCPQWTDLHAGNLEAGDQTRQTLQLTARKVFPDSRGYSSVNISCLLLLSSPKVNY